MMRGLFLFLYFLAVYMSGTVTTHAQLAKSEAYTTEDGLYGSPFDCVQDTFGNLWISTSWGVEMYDGRSFYHYGPDDNLAARDHYKITKDGRGNIWFIGANRRLSYYDIEDQSIHAYPYNDTIAKYVKGQYIFDIHVSDSTLHLFTILSTYKIHNGRFTQLSHLPKNHFGILTMEDGKRFLSSNYDHQLNDLNFIHPHKNTPTDSAVIHLPLQEKLDQFGQFVLNDTTVFVYVNRWLIKIENATVTTRKFPGNITDLKIWNGKVFVGLVYNGLHQIDINTLKTMYTYHHRNTITGLYVDRENSLWTCVFKKGLYHYPASGFVHTAITEGDDVILNTLKAENRLYAITRGSSLIEIDPVEMTVKEHFRGDTLKKALGYMITLTDSTFTFSRNRHVKFNIRSKQLNVHENNNMLLAKDYLQLNDSVIVYAYQYALRTLNTHVSSPPSMLKISGINYVNGLSKQHAEKGLVFTDNSIYELQTNPLRAKVIHDAATITDTCRLNGNLLMVDERRGLFIIVDGNRVRAYEPEDLSFIHPTSCVCSDSVLWLTSYNGLYAYDLQARSLTHYTRYDGLSSLRLKKVYVADDGSIWVATETGFDRFDRKMDTTGYTPKIRFDSLQVDGLKAATKAFDYSSKQYVFYFSGSCFKCHGEIRYQYRIAGNQSTWINTKEPVAVFTKLPPDMYTFEVRAVTPDNEYSNPVTINFEVLSPFWTKSWFVISCIVLTFLIGFAIYITRTRTLRREHRLRSALQNNQQQMIGMQMNPHFIFNSLNSIQTYIFNNDPAAANNYISKFGKLMRLYLNNSAEQSITLAQEIQSLRQYIELENLRLKFGVILKVDTSEISDLTVYHMPIFFIQPILENSIWHGIAGKEIEGEIHLKVTQRDKVLRFTITDNGKGIPDRQSAPETHRVRSTQINKKRLRLLSDLYDKKFAFEVNNRHNAQGKIIGALTIIELPVVKINRKKRVTELPAEV